MIAWFGNEGRVNPVKFRIKDEEENLKVIKINKILKVEKEKIAGNIMHKFTCMGVINGIEKLFEVKYEINTCKWTLFKI